MPTLVTRPRMLLLIALLHTGTTAHVAAQGLPAADDSRHSTLREAMLGVLPPQAAIPRARGQQQCIDLPIESANDRLLGPHGDSLLSARCEIVDYQSIGGTFSPDGTRHYSVCMMDDQLVEIDTRALRVARRLHVTASRRPAGAQPVSSGQGDAVACAPTWAQPSVDGRDVYVACNESSEIVDVDVPSWSVRRRLPAGDGVHNLAVTHNGQYLLGTNKRGQSLSVLDLGSGTEAARIPTRRRIVHGVVVSPDDRCAFVTEEGIASDPGTVEVLDLEALRSVASLEVGAQAAGIDFWRTEATTP